MPSTLDTNLLLAPLSLVRGGNHNNGSLSSQSEYGDYWSRQLNNAASGYYLHFRSGVVAPQKSDYRGRGFALRCLRARKTSQLHSIFLAPLSLVRGGYYLYSNGAQNSRSSFGYYWSRRLDSAASGDLMYFSSGGIFPQYFYYIGFGFALRCLAR